MTARCVIEVNAERLAQELGWWLDAQESAGNGCDASLEAAAVAAHTTARNLRRVLAGEGTSSDLAERILLAIDYREGPRWHPVTGKVLPLVIRSRYLVDGRKRQPGETGRIKKVDFSNAKLTEKQLRAIYKLHIEGGISLRELCRRGWEQWGYASAKTAHTSITERLHSIGLKPRSRSEATALANKARATKRLPGETKVEYKRRARRELRESSPEAQRAHQDRLAYLRVTYDRRARSAA